MNILIVDDAFPGLMGLWVKKMGHSPFLARTLREAKKILIDEKIDVCILDINLGGELGIELLDDLNQAKVIPILITAYYNIRHIIQTDLTVLEKPIDYQQLEKILKGLDNGS